MYTRTNSPLTFLLNVYFLYQMTNAISTYRIPFKENKILWICSIFFLTFWLSTLIGTSNLSNWIMENALVIISLILIIICNKKYQFSDLSFISFFLVRCYFIIGYNIYTFMVLLLIIIRYFVVISNVTKE